MVRQNDNVKMEKHPLEQIGPTGKYPQGKVTEHDQGGLAVAIGTDKKRGIIQIEFGTSLTWLGLTADDARAFANQLLERADDLES